MRSRTKADEVPGPGRLATCPRLFVQLGDVRDVGNDTVEVQTEPPRRLRGRISNGVLIAVAGSSVFPTGGAANPTLTLVALAFRLADRLRGELA